MGKPLLSLSMDLDNLWAYLKIKGDPNWQSLPSYLDFFLIDFLNLLDELDVSITFFLIGQDAALKKNQELFKELVVRGHEVANHTFNHEPWLHLYSKQQLEDEIVRAEEAIFEATGKKPVGFRGPGFTWSKDLLSILIKRGYIYDSSMLPTFIGPVARLYYFWVARLDKEAQNERKKLYGSFKEGFTPIDPYLWQLEEGNLIELPVTTMPIVRTPFHLSYLMYINSFSPTLAKGYFQTAAQSCRLFGTGPNFLLHPPDFLDTKQVPEMGFFPGLKFPKEQKKDFFRYTIETFKRHFTLCTLSERAQVEGNLKVKKP